MDSHGSRVKKYGIYIDQLVEKIKALQTCSQDIFDIISTQTAMLFENKDQDQDLAKERGTPQISIASAAEKVQQCLIDVHEILESFYDEGQILFQAGIDLQPSDFNMKFINEAILQNI